MPWVLDVRKGHGRQFFVRLVEIDTMNNGVLVATGRHTAQFEGTAGGDFSSVERILRESMESMEKEPMLSFKREQLTVACVIGEHLSDLLLDDGGDDIEQMV